MRTSRLLHHFKSAPVSNSFTSTLSRSVHSLLASLPVPTVFSRSSSSLTSLPASSLRGDLSSADVLSLPSTPSVSPSYPRGPYTFYNREYFIIVFESDPEEIRKRVPEPLVPAPGNLVLYEWISMPDSTGFGSYTESGVVIPCLLNGEEVNFTQSMFLDLEPPIAAGREIWGFPKKYAKPVFGVKNDTIFGTLSYAGQPVANGTMVYKYKEIDNDLALKALTKTNVNLKIIPDVNLKPKLAQLVAYNLTNIRLKGAWEGPARLNLHGHINAPVSDFPIKRIVTGKHYLADITLPYGRVVHDYLKEARLNENKVNSLEYKREAERTAQGYLTRNCILNTLCMPVHAPSYHVASSTGEVYHQDREYFIIEYISDITAIRKILPDVLYANPEGKVLLEFVHTTGSGLGDYSKLDILIPCTDKNGQAFQYGVQSYVDSSASITMGRELLGMAQKFAHPSLTTQGDTLVGQLTYAGSQVANGTMPYKQRKLLAEEAQKLLETAHIGIKFIPDVDGEPAIAQLIRSDRRVLEVHDSHVGSAALNLMAHANAPLDILPIKTVTNGYHIRCDLTQQPSTLFHDYLEKKD